MGTKRNPAKYDCYKAAHPDEPMFVLLGRDPLAAQLVRIWARIRLNELAGAEEEFRALIEDAGTRYHTPDEEKALSALGLADHLAEWHQGVQLQKSREAFEEQRRKDREGAKP